MNEVKIIAVFIRITPPLFLCRVYEHAKLILSWYTGVEVKIVVVHLGGHAMQDGGF